MMDDKALKAIMDEIDTQISARTEQARNEKITLHYHQIAAEIRGLERARQIIVGVAVVVRPELPAAPPTPEETSRDVE